ncbi:DUF4932 domain-containing protein [Chryseobacterium sp. SSA4.19]|uniref:DUF4932 domain-containing protein n=1 Tax=Chryseobacterium sp. SSA4.19 TaxID=2919915 RepID=UPI001F4E9D45|nr:DUF4932 domain-containing protein [Chryseobacterium sp. SSA4.19]MCJ8155033.1 DUF4932 domain-containing protein [Chryseobacterium sp. SSA4.19]
MKTLKMINKSILTLMMFLLAVNLKSQSKVDVEFNPNIATYSIAEYLVAKHQGRLFYIDGKTDISYLPLADLANKEMGKYDNSKIIKAMQDYLQIVGQQQDLAYQTLIKHNIFPAKGYAYEIEENERNKKETVEQFAEQLREFYIERKLGIFFKSQSHFIEGAKNEVRKNIPAGYMIKMEKYYGQRFLAYRFYVNPFDVLPYSEVFWHGNGPMFRSEKGQIANMISSAYVPLKKKNDIKDYTEFGFNHQETTNFLITHEFGHSFVNQYLGQYEAKINQSNHLMSEAFISKMDAQGYSYWPSCVGEHIVRTGEIRIALANANPELAKKLRQQHIKENSFVLIPDFEKKMEEYENNITKYKSFKDFVPELLTVLDETSVEKIRAKLGLPNEKYEATITVNVPENSGDVYITGNQSSIGSWNPQKIKLDKTNETTRKITFTTYPDLRFKLTKGSWDTEAKIDGIEEGKDVSLLLDKNTTLNYTVKNWKQ